MKNLYIAFFWLALAFVLVLFTLRVYADTRPPVGPLGYNHWFVDMSDKNLKEWKLEDHVKPEPVIEKKVVKEVVKELPKETKSDRPFDLDKYARAVARHETASCTKGYGKMYNNCFGIKNGRIAPCKKIGKNRMCIYETPEESYEAFKKIWKEGYGNKFPTLRHIQVYSGNDRAVTYLANVTKFYEEQF